MTRSTVTHLDSQSHELQLKYDTQGTNGIVGLYYFKERPLEHTGTRQFAPAGPNAGKNIQAQESFNTLATQSRAIYGQISHDLSEKLAITVGARYTSDSKQAIVGSYNPAGGLLAQPTGNLDYDGDGVIDAFKAHKTFDAFNWRLTSTYHFTPDVMLYGTVSTGFKAGGYAGDVIKYTVNPACSPATPQSCVLSASPVQAYNPERLTEVAPENRTGG